MVPEFKKQTVGKQFCHKNSQYFLIDWYFNRLRFCFDKNLTMQWSKMDTWVSLRSHRVNKSEKVSYSFGSVTADYCLYKWYSNQTDWKYFIGHARKILSSLTLNLNLKILPWHLLLNDVHTFFWLHSLILYLILLNSCDCLY